MISAIELFSRRFKILHLRRMNHIQEPQIDWFHADLMSNGIHAGLDRQTDTRPCDAAIGENWTFVGCDRGDRATICGNNVRAGKQICDLCSFNGR